jgi:hypothetical protein
MLGQYSGSYDFLNMRIFCHFLYVHRYQFLWSKVYEPYCVGWKLLPLKHNICLKIKMRLVNKAIVVLVYHDSYWSLVLYVLGSHISIVLDFICKHVYGHLLGNRKVKQKILYSLHCEYEIGEFCVNSYSLLHFFVNRLFLYMNLLRSRKLVIYFGILLVWTIGISMVAWTLLLRHHCFYDQKD